MDYQVEFKIKLALNFVFKISFIIFANKIINKLKLFKTYENCNKQSRKFK